LPKKSQTNLAAATVKSFGDTPQNDLVGGQLSVHKWQAFHMRTAYKLAALE
jgi:hypothetical protein